MDFTQKMRSDLWKRWGWCLPLFAGFLAIAPAMHRDFWFDEALTILNFALMEDPAVIYRNEHYKPAAELKASLDNFFLLFGSSKTGQKLHTYREVAHSF